MRSTFSKGKLGRCWQENWGLDAEEEAANASHKSLRCDSTTLVTEDAG